MHRYIKYSEDAIKSIIITIKVLNKTNVISSYTVNTRYLPWNTNSIVLGFITDLQLSNYV